MYFGTEDGLNIYDGYSFTILRSANNPNSLSYNDITALCEDNKNRIWVGTFNSGVTLYIPEEKKFIRFNYQIGIPNSLSNDNINAVIQDNEGIIWVGTDRGLNRISPEKSGFYISRGISEGAAAESLTEERFLSLMVDKDGIIWGGTDKGLVKIVKDANNPYYSKTLYTHKINNTNSISDNTVRSVYEDTKGNLWIGTDNGLNRLSARDRNKAFPLFRRFFYKDGNNVSLTNNEIYAIGEDASGTVWIGTNGAGIYIFDRDKKQFDHYINDPLDSRSLTVNEIRSIFCDRSGIMWIGTYGGGINKVSRAMGQFYHYKHYSNDPKSLSHGIIWSFYQDSDSILWIGTHNGLDRLDRKTNTFKHYYHIPGKNSLSNNVVRVITPTDDGRLLLGTNGGGVDLFDPGTGVFKNYLHSLSDSNTLSYDQIRSIYLDRDGIIWIGTYGKGLDRLDPSTGIFRHYYNIPGDEKSLSQDYVRVIIEDHKGFLWIGTEGGGLNKFDKKSGEFTIYRAQPGSADVINSDYIFSIFEDTSGYLWLGTYGGGLNKFNPATGKAESYSTEAGLPSGSVYGALKDNQGNFWLSTTNGLSKFNPETGKVKNYNIKDGLQDNEFNGGSYYKSESGELFFGGINGFNSFYPENIKDNNYIPPVVITSFKKFNEEVSLPKPVYSISDIDLDYSDNVFSFEFAALDYSAPGKNRYAYKMEGVDKDWVFVSADKRFASYTTLSPGEYTFYVKGSNSDGVWNEEATVMTIRIIPPFWQRWWFTSLSALLIIGIAYLFYLRRLRVIRMKIELSTAHDAQLSIMPQSDPVNDKLEISGTCIPANEVGGDFFDYFHLGHDQSKFGIMIGDVSGKAMKAAVTAIMSSGMIISEMRSNKQINFILDSVNDSLLTKIEKKMFVSACICLIDTQTNTLSLANAGLNRPILLSEGNVAFLQSEGPRLPLGVKNDVGYQQISYELKKKDIIIFTTDGVNEAQNADRELFGDDRLKNYLLSIDTESLTVQEIKSSIIKQVQNFIKKEKPTDDMTVLVIRVK
jgi:ligand-binding sensor domain-containing protein/serine phosphatase RsbU (regulator of sigma subunit)